MTQPGGSPPPMPRNTSRSSPTWSLATRAAGPSKPRRPISLPRSFRSLPPLAGRAGWGRQGGGPSHDRFADRVQADLVGAGTKQISTQRPQEVQYGSGTNPEFL